MNNKKIIFQVTRIYMKKNWRRTLITYIGIIIMVVLMTSVFVGKDTILKFIAVKPTVQTLPNNRC